jgi:SAM-dependent methyltransferase
MQPRQTPAEAYQEYFAPAIFEPLASELVGVAPPRAGDRVLDVACGTGVVTRRAAAIVGPTGRVVGVDINPGMVAVAQSQPGVDSVAIEYRQGDAQALDLPNGSYDVVYCQQGVQFLPDRAAGLREMRRVLRNGGRVAIAVWHGLDRHPLYAALTEAELPHLNRFGVEVTRGDLVAPFSLGDRDELAALLAGAGLRDIEIVSRTIEARFATPDRFVERLEYAYAAVVPVFAADPAAFADYLAAIDRETKSAVERCREGEWVVVPMHTHIAVARA